MYVSNQFEVKTLKCLFGHFVVTRRQRQHFSGFYYEAIFLLPKTWAWPVFLCMTFSMAWGQFFKSFWALVFD
jgi:hypothetical protein